MKEIGATEKRVEDGEVKIALLYPGSYRESASSLGYNIIYDVLNSEDGVVAHRFNTDSPFSVEQGLPIKSYDYIVVSLHYEPQLVTLVRYLKRLGIEPDREKREDKRIFIGGPGVWNPLVASVIADGIFVGDGEDSVKEFMNVIHLDPPDWTLDGFFNPWYPEPTTFSYHDMSYQYSHILSDDTAYGEYPVYIEVNRGCRFACRFCLIGWTQRPPRSRKYSQVLSILEDHFERGGKKVIFFGSDVLAYKHIERILDDLAYFNIPFAIPSTRVDKLTDEFLEILGRGGVKNITIAPETAHFKRKIFISKPIKNEDVIDATRRAKRFGIKKVKLYFMIGYPDTTKEEVDDIIALVKSVRRIMPVTGTVSVFVPKPFTPFQYLPMEDIEKTRRTLSYIKKHVPFLDVGNSKKAALQTLLSVGDESVGRLLLEGYKNYNYFYWKRIAPKYGVDFERILYGPREAPWEKYISTSVSKKLIEQGYKSAVEVWT